MPIPLAIIAGGTVAAKGLSSYFGNKKKKKEAAEQKRAATSGANIKQQMSEDDRRGRLRLGSSILGGVQGPGGASAAIDPAVLDELMKERKYDFGSAIPDVKGGTESFLSGLFGDVAETLPMLAGGTGAMMGGLTRVGGSPAGGGGSISWQDLLKMIGGPKHTSYGGPGPQPDPYSSI